MSEASANVPLFLERSEFGPGPGLLSARDEDGVRTVAMPMGFEAWLVTRLRDVRQVLDDPVRFSNAHDGLLRPAGAAPRNEEAAAARAGNLLACDPPEHTRLRRMLAPAFSAGRMRAMLPAVRQIVGERLDALERSGPPADLMAELALPLPSLVLHELLGVPHADREELARRAGLMLAEPAAGDQWVQTQARWHRYLAALVARARTDPGTGLLSTLVQRHGQEVTTEELVGMIDLVVLAGHETTAHMLGMAVCALLHHPDQLELLRARPHLIDAAVEELLRWLSIVNSGSAKVTTAEVEIGGRRIGPGRLVICSLPAANRDPQLVADPDRLDITRGAPGHLAFGHGVHYCLGAPLARMELRVAVPALLERFPGLRATAAPDFGNRHAVYGLRSLPVTW
ncbi:Cytochrome P450 FAS1 [Streptomyces sp. enrichment culture]|uniref:cytochrome P450 n=1 Tax=Streptomyces sp. enrichment culture TaxID=1795815 RepID=UPI003F55729C